MGNVGSVQSPLPDAWEYRFDGLRNKAFYVNHLLKRLSFQHPAIDQEVNIDSHETSYPDLLQPSLRHAMESDISQIIEETSTTRTKDLFGDLLEETLSRMNIVHSNLVQSRMDQCFNISPKALDQLSQKESKDSPSASVFIKQLYNRCKGKTGKKFLTPLVVSICKRASRGVLFHSRNDPTLLTFLKYIKFSQRDNMTPDEIDLLVRFSFYLANSTGSLRYMLVCVRSLFDMKQRYNDPEVTLVDALKDLGILVQEVVTATLEEYEKEQDESKDKENANSREYNELKGQLSKGEAMMRMLGNKKTTTCSRAIKFIVCHINTHALAKSKGRSYEALSSLLSLDASPAAFTELSDLLTVLHRSMLEEQRIYSVIESLFTLGADLKPHIKTVRLIMKILENVIKKPEVEKYRRVRTGGSTFKSTLGAVPNNLAVRLLEAVGFKPTTQGKHSYLSLPNQLEQADLGLLQFARNNLNDFFELNSDDLQHNDPASSVKDILSLLSIHVSMVRQLRLPHSFLNNSRYRADYNLHSGLSSSVGALLEFLHNANICNTFHDSAIQILADSFPLYCPLAQTEVIQTLIENYQCLTGQAEQKEGGQHSDQPNDVDDDDDGDGDDENKANDGTVAKETKAAREGRKATILSFFSLLRSGYQDGTLFAHYHSLRELASLSPEYSSPISLDMLFQSLDQSEWTIWEELAEVAHLSESKQRSSRSATPIPTKDQLFNFSATLLANLDQVRSNRLSSVALKQEQLEWFRKDSELHAILSAIHKLNRRRRRRRQKVNSESKRSQPIDSALDTLFTIDGSSSVPPFEKKYDNSPSHSPTMSPSPMFNGFSNARRRRSQGCSMLASRSASPVLTPSLRPDTVSPYLSSSASSATSSSFAPFQLNANNLPETSKAPFEAMVRALLNACSSTRFVNNNQKDVADFAWLLQQIQRNFLSRSLSPQHRHDRTLAPFFLIKYAEIVFEFALQFLNASTNQGQREFRQSIFAVLLPELIVGLTTAVSMPGHIRVIINSNFINMVSSVLNAINSASNDTLDYSPAFAATINENSKREYSVAYKDLPHMLLSANGSSSSAAEKQLHCGLCQYQATTWSEYITHCTGLQANHEQKSSVETSTSSLCTTPAGSTSNNWNAFLCHSLLYLITRLNARLLNTSIFDGGLINHDQLVANCNNQSTTTDTEKVSVHVVPGTIVEWLKSSLFANGLTSIDDSNSSSNPLGNTSIEKEQLEVDKSAHDQHASVFQSIKNSNTHSESQWTTIPGHNIFLKNLIDSTDNTPAHLLDEHIKKHVTLRALIRKCGSKDNDINKALTYIVASILKHTGLVSTAIECADKAAGNKKIFLPSLLVQVWKDAYRVLSQIHRHVAASNDPADHVASQIVNSCLFLLRLGSETAVDDRASKSILVTTFIAQLHSQKVLLTFSVLIRTVSATAENRLTGLQNLVRLAEDPNSPVHSASTCYDQHSRVALTVASALRALRSPSSSSGINSGLSGCADSILQTLLKKYQELMSLLSNSILSSQDEPVYQSAALDCWIRKLNPAGDTCILWPSDSVDNKVPAATDADSWSIFTTLFAIMDQDSSSLETKPDLENHKELGAKARDVFRVLLLQSLELSQPDEKSSVNSHFTTSIARLLLSRASSLFARRVNLAAPLKLDLIPSSETNSDNNDDTKSKKDKGKPNENENTAEAGEEESLLKNATDRVSVQRAREQIDADLNQCLSLLVCAVHGYDNFKHSLVDDENMMNQAITLLCNLVLAFPSLSPIAIRRTIRLCTSLFVHFSPNQVEQTIKEKLDPRFQGGVIETFIFLCGQAGTSSFRRIKTQSGKVNSSSSSLLVPASVHNAISSGLVQLLRVLSYTSDWTETIMSCLQSCLDNKNGTQWSSTLVLELEQDEIDSALQTRLALWWGALDVLGGYIEPLRIGGLVSVLPEAQIETLQKGRIDVPDSVRDETYPHGPLQIKMDGSQATVIRFVNSSKATSQKTSDLFVDIVYNNQKETGKIASVPISTVTPCARVAPPCTSPNFSLSISTILSLLPFCLLSDSHSNSNLWSAWNLDKSSESSSSASDVSDLLSPLLRLKVIRYLDTCLNQALHGKIGKDNIFQLVQALLGTIDEDGESYLVLPALVDHGQETLSHMAETVSDLEICLQSTLSLMHNQDWPAIPASLKELIQTDSLPLVAEALARLQKDEKYSSNKNSEALKEAVQRFVGTFHKDPIADDVKSSDHSPNPNMVALEPYGYGAVLNRHALNLHNGNVNNAVHWLLDNGAATRALLEQTNATEPPVSWGIGGGIDDFRDNCKWNGDDYEYAKQIRSQADKGLHLDRTDCAGAFGRHAHVHISRLQNKVDGLLRAQKLHYLHKPSLLPSSSSPWPISKAASPRIGQMKRISPSWVRHQLSKSSTCLSLFGENSKSSRNEEEDDGVTYKWYFLTEDNNWAPLTAKDAEHLESCQKQGITFTWLGKDQVQQLPALVRLDTMAMFDGRLCRGRPVKRSRQPSSKQVSYTRDAAETKLSVKSDNDHHSVSYIEEDNGNDDIDLDADLSPISGLSPSSLQLVESLSAMGFPKEWCARALTETGYHLEQAANWIFMNNSKLQQEDRVREEKLIKRALDRANRKKLRDQQRARAAKQKSQLEAAAQRGDLVDMKHVYQRSGEVGRVIFVGKGDRICIEIIDQDSLERNLLWVPLDALEHPFFQTGRLLSPSSYVASSCLSKPLEMLGIAGDLSRALFVHTCRRSLLSILYLTTHTLRDRMNDFSTMLGLTCLDCSALIDILKMCTASPQQVILARNAKAPTVASNDETKHNLAQDQLVTPETIDVWEVIASLLSYPENEVHDALDKDTFLSELIEDAIHDAKSAWTRVRDVSSSHPYLNGEHAQGCIEIANAKQLLIVFDRRSNLNQAHGCLQFFTDEKYTNEIAAFTGSGAGFYDVVLPGSKFYYLFQCGNLRCRPAVEPYEFGFEFRVIGLGWDHPNGEARVVEKPLDGVRLLTLIAGRPSLIKVVLGHSHGHYLFKAFLRYLQVVRSPWKTVVVRCLSEIFHTAMNFPKELVAEEGDEKLSYQEVLAKVLTNAAPEIDGLLSSILAFYVSRMRYRLDTAPWIESLTNMIRLIRAGDLSAIASNDPASIWLEETQAKLDSREPDWLFFPLLRIESLAVSLLSQASDNKDDNKNYARKLPHANVLNKAYQALDDKEILRWCLKQPERLLKLGAQVRSWGQAREAWMRSINNFTEYKQVSEIMTELFDSMKEIAFKESGWNTSDEGKEWRARAAKTDNTAADYARLYIEFEAEVTWGPGFDEKRRAFQSPWAARRRDWLAAMQGLADSVHVAVASPEEALEFRWTKAQDRQFVEWIDEFIERDQRRLGSLTFRDIHALTKKEAEQFPLLSDIPATQLRARFAVFKMVSTDCYRIAPLVDLFEDSPASLGPSFRELFRSFVYKHSKTAFWEYGFQGLWSRESPQFVILNRRISTRPTSSPQVRLRNSIFNQLYQHVGKLVDPYALRRKGQAWMVKFVGEGGHDSGGLFNESLNDICVELQSEQAPIQQNEMANAVDDDEKDSKLDTETPLEVDQKDGKSNNDSSSMLQIQVPDLKQSSPASSETTASSSSSSPAYEVSTLPRLPLLRLCPNGRTRSGDNRGLYVLNSASTSPAELDMFEFLGRLMGLTCVDTIETNQALPLSLAPLHWKRLVGDKLTLADLKTIDIGAFQTIHSMRNLKQIGIQSQSDFEQTFPDMKFVCVSACETTIELLPNGAHIPVTFDRATEYADLMEHVRLHEFDVCIKAVARGMASMVPINYMPVFNWSQLEVLVASRPDIDVDLLAMKTRYQGRLRATDRHIKLFWQVLNEMKQEDRRAFLHFVWGRTRLPPTADSFGGDYFLIMHHHKSLRSRKPADDYLPVAHTCFFSLELPNYSSVEVMRDRILYAIHNCATVDGDTTLESRANMSMNWHVEDVDEEDDQL